MNFRLRRRIHPVLKHMFERLRGLRSSAMVGGMHARLNS